MPGRGADRLYDNACDALLAAQELRRTAAATDTDEVLAATVGCLAAALEEIAAATDEMRRRLPAPRRATAERELAALSAELRRGVRSADRARAAVAALHGASSGRP